MLTVGVQWASCRRCGELRIPLAEDRDEVHLSGEESGGSLSPVVHRKRGLRLEPTE